MCQVNEKLRILLANNNWTQSKLAKALYVSPDTVSSWVRGKNCLSIEMLKRISVLFWKLPVGEIKKRLPYILKKCYPRLGWRRRCSR